MPLRSHPSPNLTCAPQTQAKRAGASALISADVPLLFRAACRLVSAILPPAKRAMHAAFKVEGAMSLDSRPDGCHPPPLLWGISLAGAVLVGFGLSALFRSRRLGKAAECFFGGVSSWLSRIALALSKAGSGLVQQRGRGIANRTQTFSSAHASSCAGTGMEPSNKKTSKNSRRDSTMFTYVSTNESAGSDRMSLELCMGCVEMNRLMRKIAADTGKKFESEPCDLCKERARSRLQCCFLSLLCSFIFLLCLRRLAFFMSCQIKSMWRWHAHDLVFPVTLDFSENLLSHCSIQVCPSACVNLHQKLTAVPLFCKHSLAPCSSPHSRLAAFTGGSRRPVSHDDKENSTPFNTSLFARR